MATLFPRGAPMARHQRSSVRTSSVVSTNFVLALATLVVIGAGTSVVTLSARGDGCAYPGGFWQFYYDPQPYYCRYGGEIYESDRDNALDTWDQEGECAFLRDIYDTDNFLVMEWTGTDNVYRAWTNYFEQVIGLHWQDMDDAGVLAHEAAHAYGYEIEAEAEAAAIPCGGYPLPPG